MPTGTNVLGPDVARPDRGWEVNYFLLVPDPRLESTVVSLLGFQPGDRRVASGWLRTDQTLSALQIIGVLLVIGSIWLGQRSNRTSAYSLPEVALDPRMA